MLFTVTSSVFIYAASFCGVFSGSFENPEQSDGMIAVLLLVNEDISWLKFYHLLMEDFVN